jgi:hypothetical protein
MQTPRMRPLLRARVALPRMELVRRLEAALDAPDATCRGRASARYAALMVREEVRHFWSPTLQLEIFDEGAGVRLWGRFGPHPEVWVMFLGLYAVTGFSVIAGLVLGGAQAFIDQEPWGLLIALGSLIFGLCLYAASFFGQRIGYGQMIVLESFLRAAAAAPIEVLDGP